MAHAIYLRLSRETDSSTSIDRQRIDCRALCERLGLEGEAVEFKDVDVSGFRDVSRPGRDELMLRLAEFSHIVVWKFDRLARSVVDASRILKECQERGVSLVAVHDPIDLSNPMGLAFAQISSVLAELESANIGARVASSRRYLAQGGYFSGGRVPFGYELESDEGHRRLVVKADEAAIIHEMVKRLLTGSIRSVAVWLNEQHPEHPPRGSNRWSGAGVRALLASRTLTGNTTHQGQLVLDDNGLPKQTHEAILTPAQHAAVMARFAERSQSRTRSTGTAASSPLHGAVTCHHCTRIMTFAQKRKGQFEYKCGTEGCRLRISAKQLENYVIPLIVIGFRQATEVRTIITPPDTTVIDQQIQDLKLALRAGRITTQLFLETTQMLEANKPQPVADVEHLHLFDRWNVLTAPERAAEIRRAARIEVRRVGEWGHRDLAKQVLVTPLVDGLFDPWFHGEGPFGATPALLNNWVFPKRFDSGLLLPDGAVQIPWEEADQHEEA